MTNNILKVRKLFKNNLHETILIILFAIYNIYITSVSFLRHEHFFSRRFDLGNMDQTVWNTLNGNIFMFTDPYGTEQISRMAYHADVILVLLSPLYLIWQDPKMLLLIQTIVVSFGGIFVYLISLKLLKNKTISLALSFAYFINPALQHSNIYDFHSVVLGTTFLLAAFYFILVKKWWLVIIFLILAGITKENVWAITAIYGLYIAFISKRKALGLIITGVSVALFLYLFWFLIPSFTTSGKHFALKFLNDFGNSPSEIIIGILTNPIDVIKAIFTGDNLSYLNKLFLPLGFLSVFGFPLLIFASPDLAINLIGDNPSMKGVWNQYTATITPFIFISAIYGIRFINQLNKIKLFYISIFVVIMSMLGAYLYGPMHFAKQPTNKNYVEAMENKYVIDNYLESFPNETKLAVTNNLGAHLSYRKDIYLVQFAYEKADYAIFFMRDPFKVEIETLEKVFNDPNFELEYQDDKFYVFKRVDS